MIMENILILPPEIRGHIFAILIEDNGIKAAVRVRATCKMFDRCVSTAIWMTRALEVHDVPQDGYPEHLLSAYLLARSRADRMSRKYKLTTVIYKTVENLQQMTEFTHLPETDYIKAACSAIVHSRQQPRTLQKHRLPHLKDVFTEADADCLLSENVLALSAYLGLASVIERLVREGVRDVKTCFGSPLICVSKHSDPSITACYLRAKLKLRERCEPSFTTEDYLYGAHGIVATFRRAHRRDISIKSYADAIGNAIIYGTSKSVDLLMKSAADDNEWFTSLGFMCWGGCIRSAPTEPLLKTWSYVLMCAARCRRIDTVRLALDRGADPNVATRLFLPFLTALEAAASNGDLSMFQLLLDRGADPHWAPKPVRHLLRNAVSGGSWEIMNLCLDAGVQMCHLEPSQLHSNPLVAAVRGNRPDMLRSLLSRGINFEPGSDLDRELSEQALVVKSVEIDLILDANRNERIGGVTA